MLVEATGARKTGPEKENRERSLNRTAQGHRRTEGERNTNIHGKEKDQGETRSLVHRNERADLYVLGVSDAEPYCRQ